MAVHWKVLASTHAAHGYYTCDSSLITLLLLHHKVFVIYHKNGLVVVTDLLADGSFKKLAF